MGLFFDLLTVRIDWIHVADFTSHAQAFASQRAGPATQLGSKYRAFMCIRVTYETKLMLSWLKPHSEGNSKSASRTGKEEAAVWVCVFQCHLTAYKERGSKQEDGGRTPEKRISQILFK